jgi:hypothetical protein
MKRALHWFLAAALLTQGAMAAAMPVVTPVAKSESSMPCHDGAQKTPSLPCCGQGDCHCAAMCAAVALAPAVFALNGEAPAAQLLSMPRAAIRAAHSLAPLRPPIAVSA